MTGAYLPRTIATLLAVCVVLVASVGCHNPYKSGLEDLSEGRYSDAETGARELLREDPDNPEYQLLMAEALIGQEQYREAEPYARKAFESGAVPGPSGRALGKVLWELGQPIPAVESWRSARAADPTSVEDDDYARALETALAVAMSVREFEEALKLRSELKELDADHPATVDEEFRKNRVQLAEEWVRAGRLEDAERLYGELATQTKDESYDFERGRLLTRLDREDEAIKAYQRYVDAGPKAERVDRYTSVARRAERQSVLTIAVRFYDLAISEMADKPSMRRADTHLRLAALLLAAKASDQARTHLQSFISDRSEIQGMPPQASIYLQAAQVASRNRAPNIAIEVLEEATVKATPSWRATRMLAELYARRSRTNDVERVLKKYVERADSSVDAQISVGRWAAGRRNFELARFFLETASQAKNASPTIWLELARVYSALGRGNEVRRALGTYIKSVDDERRGLLDVAGIYRGQRMYEEAEAALLRLFKKDRKDLDTARQLETLYQEWGKPKKIHDIYASWLTANGKRAEDYMLVGERFQRQNEWNEALPYYAQAARRGANDAWLQIADIYKRQRKERDMKEALEKYLAGAKNREAALNAAWQRYKTSAWSHEAVPILEELIKLDGQNVLHYESLSALYFDQGRDVEAFEIWKRYIELSRNPIRSLQTMARRFERRGHHDWMLSFLHQILEKHNDPDPKVYQLLGDAYYAANSRRTRVAMPVDPNAIFSEQDKAKRYYRLYLEKGEPTRRELQQFAESMRQKRIWDVAAKAFEKLDLTSPIHTHQLLHYGAVLLNLGRADDAKEAFAKYYERRGGSVDAARAIADELSAARRYDAMEPYLKKMMDSGDENLLRSAFMQLGDVYRQTDHPEKIVPLIGEYLAKTQNPSEARRTVLNVLENTGMWEEGVKQLQRLAEVQGDDYRFELGVMLYRRGDEDEAESAFRDFASASVTAAESWLRVARFYENHAEAEIASDAYNLAVSSSPQNHQILMDRGRFRIMTGRVEEGRRDFEDARQRVGQGQKGPISRIEVQALLAVARYAEARAASRQALTTAYLDRDYFFSVIASAELSSGDQVRMQRMVDELRGAGLEVSSLVSLLDTHGQVEAVAAAIEAEIRNGDQVVAGQLLVNYAYVFTELGGIEKLMRTAQPLLETNRREGRLAGQLGEYLVREGHPEEGALLLRSAIDRGESELRPLLARTYMTMGHYDEASRLQQAHLAAVPASGRQVSLMWVAMQYEVTGQAARFERMLEQLVLDSRYSASATPLLVRYRVQRGDVSGAAAALERLWNEVEEPEQSHQQLGEESELRELVAVLGVQAMASEGYISEALSLMDRLPPNVSSSERFRDLRLRIANASEQLDIGKEVELALLAMGDSSAEAQQKLKIAWLVMLGGHFDIARTIAEPYLSSGDLDIASEALRVLFGTGEAQGDRSNFETWANQFIKGQPDRVWARTLTSDQLRWVGADELAVKYTATNLKKVPTEATVRRAFQVGQVAGDSKMLKSAIEKYWRVSREPANDIPNFARAMAYNTDSATVTRLLDPVREVYPELWAARRTQIEIWYANGQPERARDEILDYLEAVDFEAQSVESVFEILAGMRLNGDLARFIAPRVPAENWTARSRVLLGLALLHLGLKDEALSQLDQYVELSADSSDAASDLAMELLRVEFDDEAIRYAEIGVQKGPARKNPYFYRGLARIANDDLDGARDDLKRSLDQGLGRHVGLYWAGRIALRKGHDAFAIEYLDRLANAPPTNAGDVIEPIRFALGAFRDAKKATEGVKFAEERWPLLVSGTGVTGQELIQTLAGLYEEAGKPERAFAMYNDGIHRSLIERPLEGMVNTYRNNLAYTYATSNKHVDEGLDLVRLAIVGDRKRNDSFLDTVGWLYYRQGKLEQAEAEVRRAIRTSNNPPRMMTELFDHLSTLREAQGYSREAVWHRIFIESVER